MNGAEGFVAIGYARHDDADGNQIVDALDIHVVSAKFLVEAVESFGAPFDMEDADAVFGQAAADTGDASVKIGVAFAHVFLHECERFFVRFGVEVFEGEVFEFAFDFADAETVGNGGEYFHGFARDAELLFRREIVERAHVVQAIGEFDDHDANVFRHREEHFSEILEVVLFARSSQTDFAELGDAVDEHGDFIAKLRTDGFEGNRGVFGNIMQESGGDGAGLHANLREDFANGQGVLDVVLSGFAFLSAMRFVCEGEGGRDKSAPFI